MSRKRPLPRMEEAIPGRGIVNVTTVIFKKARVNGGNKSRLGQSTSRTTAAQTLPPVQIPEQLDQSATYFEPDDLHSAIVGDEEEEGQTIQVNPPRKGASKSVSVSNTSAC